MADRRVPFRIGPVPGDAARAWLANSAAIVAAVRRRPDLVSFIPEEPLLDLSEAYLQLWSDHAAGAETFDWATEVDVEHVAAVARQWLVLAALTDDELDALGVTWAPAWTSAFYDALFVATVDALGRDEAGHALAEQLSKRPPGTSG